MLLSQGLAEQVSERNKDRVATLFCERCPRCRQKARLVSISGSRAFLDECNKRFAIGAKKQVMEVDGVTGQLFYRCTSPSCSREWSAFLSEGEWMALGTDESLLT